VGVGGIAFGRCRTGSNGLLDAGPIPPQRYPRQALPRPPAKGGPDAHRCDLSLFQLGIRLLEHFLNEMPVAGWFAGRGLRDYIEGWDHWVAFALLAVIGGKAIVDLFRDGGDTDGSVPDPTGGRSLIVLSVATSIDALAVGLSHALLQVAVWYPVAVMGVGTAGLTFCGMLLGSRVGERFGCVCASLAESSSLPLGSKYSWNIP